MKKGRNISSSIRLIIKYYGVETVKKLGNDNVNINKKTHVKTVISRKTLEVCEKCLKKKLCLMICKSNITGRKILEP